MNDLFPFYILMDPDFKILNFGRSSKKSFNLKKGHNFFNSFEIERPLGVTCYSDVIKHQNSPFVFRYLENKKLKLRGQIIQESLNNNICFLGTPLLNSLQDLTALNIKFSDLPIHDSIGQHILSMQVQNSALNDLKNAALKVQLYNARLEKTNESLDHFIYKMSHDLRSPAVNINNMVKMLITDLNLDANSKSRSTLNYLEQASSDLLNTISAFLSMTHIEKNNNKYEELFLLPLVQDALDIELRQSLHSKITSVLKIDENLKVFIIKEDLKTIFKNLITNSIKFKGDAQPLLIEISANQLKNGAIQILYTDNGKGIDLNKYNSKIFKMFQKFHDDKTISGAGVGLYLIQRLVEKNQGTIDITSQIDKGTCFKMNFNPYNYE